MTIEPLTPQYRRFEISNVLRSMGSAVGRNFLVFFGLAVLLQGLPTAVLGWFQHGSLVPIMENGGGAGDFSQLSKIWLFSAIGGLIGFVASNVLVVALTKGVVNNLRGLSTSLGDCLSTGLRYFLPAVGIALSTAICIVFGLVFFVVPGIILALGWCIAVPVLVTENRGVFGSISRSWQLTSGYKGSINEAAGTVNAEYVVVQMVASVCAGQATPEEAAKEAERRARRYYRT